MTHVCKNCGKVKKGSDDDHERWGNVFVGYLFEVQKSSKRLLNALNSMISSDDYTNNEDRQFKYEVAAVNNILKSINDYLRL